MIKALATKASADLDVIRRADDRLRKKTNAIMEAQQAACDLTDAGAHVDPAVKVDPVTGKPEGWSHRKYNIAKDSRRPEREQPGYLARATRVFESYRRGVTEQPAAPTLNVDVQIFVASPAAKEHLAAYRVIDVTAEEGQEPGK